MSNENHVVSFSGGRTSAYLCHLMMRKQREEGLNVHYVFMDTGAEHPKTYAFIRDMCRFWGLKLTCIRAKIHPEMGVGVGYSLCSVSDIGPDLAPWIDMVSKYGNPSVALAYCTSRMKIEPVNKYLTDVFGKKGWTSWLGIRADEPRRLTARGGIRYLADISDFDKADVLSWWKKQPFDLGIPEHLGNCVFCIKKGLNKIALAAKDEPELAESFICATEGEHVRVEGRKNAHKRMYRTHLHLSDVINLYAEVDRDTLYNRLRSSKSSDTGSCSESCEAIILDPSEWEDLI